MVGRKPYRSINRQVVTKRGVKIDIQQVAVSGSRVGPEEEIQACGTIRMQAVLKQTLHERIQFGVWRGVKVHVDCPGRAVLASVCRMHSRRLWRMRPSDL